MSTNFTQYSDDSIWNIDTNDNDSTYALKYLNTPENFRSFSDGLLVLIFNFSFEGPVDNIEEKTSFISTKLAANNISITKSTVKDWFTNKRRPALVSNSRTIMFQICFSLAVSIEDVRWFFNHVYFDRSFNCHTIEEAIYYYCFSNGYSYSHAIKLLQKIESFPIEESTDNAENIFTKDIRDRLDYYSSDEELLSFFKVNKSLFGQWNKSANKYIGMYLSQIQGKRSDKAIIDRRKNDTTISQRDIDKCGLVIQEFLSFNNRDFIDDISGKNIASIDFMLDCIFNTNKRLHKDAKIPNIVKSNFPSKKVFSDILYNIDTTTSYDSIRKCLILLKFYHFWCKIYLNPKLINDASAFDIYLDESNDMLTSCGYEEMFSGNPYDWFFLCASTCENPLDYFRDAINNIFIDND